MGERKLTKAQLEMLDRIARTSPILELALTASGGKAYSVMKSLIREGLVRGCDHPSVMAGKYPADAIEITPEGRSALEASK